MLPLHLHGCVLRMMRRLHGLRIVDFMHEVTTTYCSRMLFDGFTVILQFIFKIKFLQACFFKSCCRYIS
ncbi:hypothetical protein AF384_24360 [Salmonella enterica subsp. enterica serovar Typhimurium]|nr:hypothetical protein AF384_24360 [Salmonella enterica subsp. enterica serovar Typhimurium]